MLVSLIKFWIHFQISFKFILHYFVLLTYFNNTWMSVALYSVHEQKSIFNILKYKKKYGHWKCLHFATHLSSSLLFKVLKFLKDFEQTMFFKTSQRWLWWRLRLEHSKVKTSTMINWDKFTYSHRCIFYVLLLVQSPANQPANRVLLIYVNIFSL